MMINGGKDSVRAVGGGGGGNYVVGGCAFRLAETAGCCVTKTELFTLEGLRCMEEGNMKGWR